MPFNTSQEWEADTSSHRGTAVVGVVAVARDWLVELTGTPPL